MRFAARLVSTFGLLLAAAGSAAAESVLFIGNSFTYGQGSAVRFYRNDTVTDLNHEGVGGVPALFKSFADQAGLDYDVALETRGGAGLDFHLASTYGYYLEALVVFGRVTGRDPRSLARNECSAFELGLSTAEAGKLQQIAFDELAAMGAVTANPAASNPRATQRCASAARR